MSVTFNQSEYLIVSYKGKHFIHCVTEADTSYGTPNSNLFMNFNLCSSHRGWYVRNDVEFMGSYWGFHGVILRILGCLSKHLRMWWIQIFVHAQIFPTSNLKSSGLNQTVVTIKEFISLHFFVCYSRKLMSTHLSTIESVHLLNCDLLVCSVWCQQSDVQPVLPWAVPHR